MSPKNVNGKAGARRRNMSIALKQEIIEKREQGVRVTDLARQYGRSASTISTMLKRELLKPITPAKGVSMISSRHDNMEKLRTVWVTEEQLKGDTLTRDIIREKAQAIYDDFLNQTPRSSTDEASEDSFNNFRKSTGIDYFDGCSKAASSDVKPAFEGFEPKVMVDEGIIFLGKSMGPVMNERREPVEETLWTEELQHSQVLQETGSKGEAEEVIFTSEIKEILEMWEKVSLFVAMKHPEKVATGYVSSIFNDTCLTHFRNILKKRKKRTPLNSFFLNPEKRLKTFVKEEEGSD